MILSVGVGEIYVDHVNVSSLKNVHKILCSCVFIFLHPATLLIIVSSPCAFFYGQCTQNVCITFRNTVMPFDEKTTLYSLWHHPMISAAECVCVTCRCAWLHVSLTSDLSVCRCSVAFSRD
jgi:hypothetical protein